LSRSLPLAMTMRRWNWMPCNMSATFRNGHPSQGLG
jgi:hypothetical protein